MELKNISDFFDNYGGSIVTECACGRVHIAIKEEVLFDEGELEGYYEKSKHYIGKYHFHDCSSVAHISLPLLGSVVFGCSCGWEFKLTELIESYKDQIFKYFEYK